MVEKKSVDVARTELKKAIDDDELALSDNTDHGDDEALAHRTISVETEPVASVPHESTPVDEDFTSQLALLRPETMSADVEAVLNDAYVEEAKEFVRYVFLSM